MKSPSTIAIKKNGVEFTTHVVFARSRFKLSGSATPGEATIVVRDEDRELSFVVGDRIQLVIDGVSLWGGLVLNIGQGIFFPVVADATVAVKMWSLSCIDYNFYLDRRVLRDTSDYTRLINVGPGRMGLILRDAVGQYMDEIPGLDYTTYVDDVDSIWDSGEPKHEAAPLGEQGEYWRRTLERMAQQGGYEFRIDGDLFLHFHAIQDLVAPWVFSDRPQGRADAVGFREGSHRDDGMQMITDALVWGGTSLNNEEVVFARYPSAPANTETVNGIEQSAATEQRALDRLASYGRWQRGEINVGQFGYYTLDDVKARAYAIVAGPTGAQTITGGGQIDGGLGQPMEQAKLAWFAHDVPGFQHIVPGAITSMIFYSFGFDASHPLITTLPLRTLEISFPTIPSSHDPEDDPETFVRFDGEFGIFYSDSRFLWKFIRRQNTRTLTRTQQATVATVTENSTSTWSGAIGAFAPEVDSGDHHFWYLPFGYIPGSTQVYLNGLLQRPRIEYFEEDPGFGVIRFVEEPVVDEDTVWVTCRTGPS